MTPRQLEGAVVAVVGADGGLGTAIAAELRTRGAQVLGAGRSSADVVVDLREATAGDALVAAAHDRHGRLDGVVNAAGIVAFGELAITEDVVIEELFLTNVLGPLWLAKRVGPVLGGRAGFLVNISGVVAEAPRAGMVPYAASKAALAAASVGLRAELRRSGVTVIDVRPPHTETGLASRPLAGTAPRLPTGLAPAVVASRIVRAIEENEVDVPSTAFA